MATSIWEHFCIVPDPRVERTKLHKLEDILVITICAVICGAETWVDIAEFGRAKEAWFRTFLALPHGIASHDTFGRVFAALDACPSRKPFNAGSRTWQAPVRASSSPSTAGRPAAVWIVPAVKRPFSFGSDRYPHSDTPPTARAGLGLD